jgi:hypothetical protein
MPPHQSPIPYSLSLQSLLSRSALLNSSFEEEFDISFSSLLLAFLVGNDSLSRWFQAYVKEGKVELQKILEERKLNQQILEEGARSPPPEARDYRMTTSAKRYLQAAEQFCQDLREPGEGSYLEPRHLMAVFIYNPWVHEKDLRRWGFNRKDWSEAFLGQVRDLWPEELDFWKELHSRAFGEAELGA